jgi:hypothetical protein
MLWFLPIEGVLRRIEMAKMALFHAAHPFGDIFFQLKRANGLRVFPMIERYQC